MLSHCLLGPTQYDDAHAVADHRAARIGIKGTAVAIRGEDTTRIVLVAVAQRHVHRDATGQGHVALAGEQALAGQMDGK